MDTPQAAHELSHPAEATPKKPATFLLRLLLFCLPMIAFSLLMNSCFIFAQKEAVAPDGSGGGLFGAAFLVIPLLAAILALPILLLGLMLRFSRTFSAYTLLFCLIYIFSGCLCMKKGNELYMDGFRQLAVRSRPLVETIKKYEREHGAPPPSLEALVPDYLPAVPGTGMGTCPKYDYDVHVGSPPRHGNTWTLTVWAPKFFDHFIYYPNQNYIQPNSGEYLEPIEDWAYYHE